METCQTCVYKPYPKKTRREAKKASLVLVLDAPAIYDLKSTENFNGASGNLLRTTLQKVGFDTTDVYVTNALYCAPPKGKVIKKEAIGMCRARLINEIRQAQPKMVLTFGGTALQAVTGDTSLKITQEQGNVIECKELPGIMILPVVSPSKILMAPGEYKVFHQVLTYAAQLFKDGKVKDPGEVQYTIVSSEKDVQVAKALLADYQYLSADIETTSLNRFSDDLSDILVLGVGYAKNKAIVFLPSSFPFLPAIFDLGKEWIWHYGYAYDVPYCHSRKLMVPFAHDSLLMHYCLNENSGIHGLEQLSTAYLGAKSYKTEANKYISSEGGFKDAPLEVLCKRVAMDVDYTLQLFVEFKATIDSSKELSKLYYNLLLPAADLLFAVSRKGLLIDTDQMALLKAQYEIRLQEILHQIQEEVGDAWDKDLYMRQTGAKSASDKFKPSSTKQLAWLVFDRFKLKPPLKKKRSTDMEVLLSFGGSTDIKVAQANLRNKYPWLASILELRSVTKELSTYVNGNVERMDSANRVHSTFNLHITSTGRLSSRDPNVQNIPALKKDVRKGFKAPQGYKLMECDYKGAELRVLAFVSGGGTLGKALTEGRDLHTELAVKFWGENFTKANRMQAKTVNFGVAYGRTAVSIAIDFAMEVKEAQALIDAWFVMYPEAKAYLDTCVDDVNAGRPLWTPFGRCRRFGLITAETVDHIHNEARNFRIQSISSDLTLISAIRIQPRIEFYGAHIVNLVHDSILVECPEDPNILKAVAAIVEEEMSATPIRELACEIPFGVDIELGDSWGTIQDISTYEQYRNFKEVRA